MHRTNNLILSADSIILTKLNSMIETLCDSGREIWLTKTNGEKIKIDREMYFELV